MADGLLGAYFGNPNLQRQGARARALAKQRDVNLLPDPKTYAVMSGLLGTAPDEMGFSVLHPQYQQIRQVAEPAFAASLLAQASPVLAPMTKGLPVGASIKDVSYRGSHVPPNAKTYGATLDDLGKIMPTDVYSSKGKNLYGIGDSQIDAEWFRAAYLSKGNPDKLVDIYRAVPKGIKDINEGDWVTTSKTYAKNHGENTLGGEYEILTKKVKANTLSSEGYPYEFGYNSNEVAATPSASMQGLLDANQRRFETSSVDASDIFGQGAKRIKYTDPNSGGVIDVLQRPDGTASVLGLEVPEAMRGQGIGQSLQSQVMQDFPEMMGQVSSKAAAKTAYRLGRRPPNQPDATLDDVYKLMDENSSVNLVSPQMQKRFMPELSQSVYPQEEAMRLAQQRAALPVEQGGLGLPVNNTAMERAKAMGFDINTFRYHGTDKDIYAFDPTKFGKNDQGWYGRGVTTDTDPEIASSYANYNEAENGQVIYPLLTRGKYMDWPEGQQPYASAKDSIQGTKDIQNLGYQGTRMTNDRDLYGNVPNIGTEQVTFNPVNVRSIFAAFDPTRSKEADILAGMLPLSLLADEENKKRLYDLMPNLLSP